MIVTIVKRNGDTVRRNLEFGERLTGLRISNLEIENREELYKLLNPDERIRQWLGNSLFPAWRMTPKKEEDNE